MFYSVESYTHTKDIGTLKCPVADGGGSGYFNILVVVCC